MWRCLYGATGLYGCITLSRRELARTAQPTPTGLPNERNSRKPEFVSTPGGADAGIRCQFNGTWRVSGNVAKDSTSVNLAGSGHWRSSISPGDAWPAQTPQQSSGIRTETAVAFLRATALKPAVAREDSPDPGYPRDQDKFWRRFRHYPLESMQARTNFHVTPIQFLRD